MSRIQKRNKVKYDINKIKRKVKRTYRPDERLAKEIENYKAFSDEIQKWVDENAEDDTYVLSLEADGVTTHLFCETDKNDPFPMILYRINSSLDGVIRGSKDEINALLYEVNIQPTFQEGLTLKILSTLFLQNDRVDSMRKALEKYKIALKEERKMLSEKR